MYYFINYLRVIATVLITNSHYSNIWPIADLAAGGLLGNILFFAASGFCLLNIKENFGKWYLKRVAKIYPVMIIFTLFSILIGDYSLLNWKDAVWLFLYPTNYIFLVWLMLCYIVFYVTAWLSKKFDKVIEIVLATVITAWILIYFIFVDKSVYHIDNVEKPFILFLYFSSMLIGALFKKHINKFNETKILNIVLLLFSLVVYFGSKIAFSKIKAIVSWQILNQLSILIVLCCMFAVFIGLEERLRKIPNWLNKAVKFIAGITLHIYIVQFALIRRMENLIFPVNFLVTTVAILAVACLFYSMECYIKKGALLAINKIKGKSNAESND